MAIRHKQKRVDDGAGTRPQPAAPIAEAIALGTAASGLVVGAIQARADDRADKNELHSPRSVANATSEHSPDGLSKHPYAIDVPHEVALAETQIPAHDGTSAVPDAATPQVSSVATPEILQGAVVEGNAPSATAGAADAAPNGMPVQPLSDLAQELAGQITASLTKAIEGAGAGALPADLGVSIANDIIQSAQHLVANLGSTAGLAQSIVAEIDPQNMVQDIVAQTAHIADSALANFSSVPAAALAEVADLPAQILGEIGTSTNLANLANLPSSILGNEGSDGPDGMLSEVFYPDGAADTLTIPDLSLAASSVLPTGGVDVFGFLGMSYLDTPTEHHGQLPGLNALNLL